MKVVGFPKQHQPSKALVSPPIPFAKEEHELKKGEYTTVKLRTVGNDPNSATREISVPYFKNGTPEELLIFFKTFQQIVVGQNLNTPAKKYAAMATFLRGDALSYWENQKAKLGAENAANFETMKKPLIVHVFPRRALRLQKRYM